MSYKDVTVQLSPTRYLLPPVGKMHVSVEAFLTPELFAATEEALWNQAAAAATYPGVTHVFLMPDTHSGYGVPVGAVVITNGSLIQAGSGYDISCGILYMKSDLHASEVVDPAKRLAWIRAVEERVATGLGSHQPDKMIRHDWKFVKDVLVHGAAPLGVHADTCERLSIPVEEKLFNPERIERGWQKTVPQLGSLGGGNHFIEMQVDPEDGSVWLMIHTGSRGFGWHTAEHYYYEGAKVRGLARNRREESWLGLDEPMGREFWAHHNAAANYAIANRHVIADGVRKATETVFGKSATTYYEISHNLIQKERIFLPDGSLVEGYVHRKGATRAFPAGHPDLRGTKWETTGHPCLIPGSMLHGAAILFALEGAKASACSVNHGSGRLLGRGDAKRSLAVLHDEIDAEMHGARVTCMDGTVIDGIVMNTERTPLDECAHAYKSLDVVLGILESEGIAKVQRRMLPVANLKGAE